MQMRALCADFPSAPLLTVSLDSSPAGCLEDQYRCLDDADFMCDDEEDEEEVETGLGVSCLGRHTEAAIKQADADESSAMHRSHGVAASVGSPMMTSPPQTSGKMVGERPLSTRTSDWEVLEN